jgi:hypothetical protein
MDAKYMMGGGLPTREIVWPDKIFSIEATFTRTVEVVNGTVVAVGGLSQIRRRQARAASNDNQQFDWVSLSANQAATISFSV